jgi:tetratricopeptide (TPR) repeat protein
VKIPVPDKNIQITSEDTLQLSSKITVNDTTYYIHTEMKGNDFTQISSRLYSKGEILISKDVDFTHLIGSDNFLAKLNNFMEQTHKSVVGQFTEMLEKSHKKSSEYLNEARSLLKKGKDKMAFQLLKEGLEVYPNDLLLLSYYGAVYSKVEKKARDGVRICRDAISKLESKVSVNCELLYPIFYLNLGKAYLGANKKKEAIRSFNIGLKSDPTNTAINEEIKKLGKRKNPIFPFLERGNPLNKYMGLLISKIGISTS